MILILTLLNAKDRARESWILSFSNNVHRAYISCIPLGSEYSNNKVKQVVHSRDQTQER